MSINTYNILIIEFNNFHEEVILSQLNFLIKENSINVHLFINDNLQKKINFNKFLNHNLKINFINSKNKLTKFIELYRIKKYIKKNKIDMVIFNTYEDKYVKLLLYLLKIKKIAIVHNADKFLKENKKGIENILVLNETISNTLKKYRSENISYFYPLIEHENENKNKIIDNRIKIVIPGLIELTRRDYLGFIELIKNVDLEKYEFILLGNILKNDGPKVYEKLKNNKLLDKVKIYKGFIPYDEYFSTLKSADLIMPLIHPNVENFEKYHKTKITAAFTMSFSFKIPLFLYKSFKEVEEYQNYSFFYDLDSFEKDLANLSKHKIEEMREKMKRDKKISFKYQQKRYLNFLKGVYEK